MVLDAVLASAHHLSVFAFSALLVAEVIILRVRLTHHIIWLLSRIDGWLGIVTILVMIVGVARVAWGAVPYDYYVNNWIFWTKMGLLSVLSFFTFVPGIRIQRWHKTSVTDAAFEVTAGDITYVRRALWFEVALLVPVPICAALMARGFGVL